MKITKEQAKRLHNLVENQRATIMEKYGARQPDGYKNELRKINELLELLSKTMKKTLTIILCVGTLFITTSGKLFNKDQAKHEHREAMNTLEDLREWITYDIAEHRTDSSLGATYLENIDQVINVLQSGR